MKLKVFTVLAGALLLSACQSDGVQRLTEYKSVVANGQVTLRNVYAINPDCSSVGNVDSRIVSPAQHGKISIVRDRDFPYFIAGNVRSVCNTRRVPVVKVIYQPERGYSGPDNTSIQFIYPRGNDRIVQFNINVR